MKYKRRKILTEVTALILLLKATHVSATPGRLVIIDCLKKQVPRIRQIEVDEVTSTNSRLLTPLTMQRE